MRKSVSLRTMNGGTASSTRTKVEREEGNSQRNKWVVGQED